MLHPCTVPLAENYSPAAGFPVWTFTGFCGVPAGALVSRGGAGGAASGLGAAGLAAGLAGLATGLAGAGAGAAGSTTVGVGAGAGVTVGAGTTGCTGATTGAGAGAGVGAALGASLQAAVNSVPASRAPRPRKFNFFIKSVSFSRMIQTRFSITQRAKSNFMRGRAGDQDGLVVKFSIGKMPKMETRLA